MTNNTFFGEFSPRALEIVDSQVIVRIILAQHPAEEERALGVLRASMQGAKESDG